MVPGGVIDDLAREYADRPVVFVEQNAFAPIGERISRFWAAHTGNSTSTPLVIVDSGHQWSNGAVDYQADYSGMVARELARPPEAEITADYVRVGDRIRAEVQLTNLSSVPLSAERNGATAHLIVYEDKHVGQTGRIVRAAPWAELTTELAPSATMTLTLETPDLSGVDWSKLHIIALADYRPGGESGPYDMLQAAIASPVDFPHKLYVPFLRR